jgi:hypothetical protein
MRRILLIILALLCSASLVLAQAPGGAVGIYSDVGGQNCNFDESGFLVQVHCFHLDSPGATAIEFKLDISSTVGWTYVAESSPFLSVGQLDTGIAYAYGNCFSGTVYLGNTFYSVTNSTPACTHIQVVSHPNPSVPGTNILMTDCTTPPFQVYLVVDGGFGVVNSNVSCTCAGSVPTGVATWGQIKSLYK